MDKNPEQSTNDHREEREAFGGARSPGEDGFGVEASGGDQRSCVTLYFLFNDDCEYSDNFARLTVNK